MKTATHCVLFLIFFFSVFHVSSQPQTDHSSFQFSDPSLFRNRLSSDLLDSSYYWKWNEAMQDWSLYLKSKTTYDSIGNPVYGLNQNWNGQSWINYAQVYYSFDSHQNYTDYISSLWDTTASVWINSNLMHATFDANDHQLTNETRYGWNGNFWSGGYLISNVYDSSGYLVSRTFQNFDSLSQSWLNKSYTAYANDANGNMLHSLNQLWNDSLGAWVNNSNQFFSYDIFNNVRHYLGEQWNGASWDTISQRFSDYDLNHNKTGELWQTWWNSAWIDYMRYTYTYDADNNNTYYYAEQWDGNWFPEAENSYTYGPGHTLVYALYRERHIFSLTDVGDYHATYDSVFNQLTSLYDHWGNGVSMPHFDFNYYTYDANNNRISEVSQQGYSYSDTDSVHHYFHPSNMQVEEMPESPFVIYPNPASGEFSINGLAHAIDALEIYDMPGKRVYAGTNILKGAKIKIPFSKGVYLVKFIFNQRIFFQKLIVE